MFLEPDLNALRDQPPWEVNLGREGSGRNEMNERDSNFIVDYEYVIDRYTLLTKI
jgi:hypothetical protein